MTTQLTPERVEPHVGSAPSEQRRAIRPRPNRLANRQRPGFLTYGFLAAVILGSVFPLYWSFLIGSGDASTITRQDIVWWPGGNFLVNAASVLENESVNFWRAIGNSIIVSTVVAVSVVFFSTLSG